MLFSLAFKRILAIAEGANAEENPSYKPLRSTAVALTIRMATFSSTYCSPRSHTQPLGEDNSKDPHGQQQRWRVCIPFPHLTL